MQCDTMADLAVLCCLPTTESDWFERYQHAEFGDFVRRNTEARGAGSPSRTWRLFCDEAAFIRRKLDSLARREVHVVTNARRADVVEAARRATNIAIVAHWKHERVFTDDIPEPIALRRSLSGCGFEISVRGKICEEGDAQCLAKYLDDLVLNGCSPLVDITGSSELGRLPPSVLRRERLDKLYPLRPGNRLELWDAMVSAIEFCDLLGEFSGTACLFACYSQFLAEVFFRRHPNGVCTSARETTRAGLNLTKLDAALTLMRAHRWPLWRALDEVGNIIDDMK